MTHHRVALLYTGGTLGMLPRDRDDPHSPLAPVPWPELAPFLPALEQLPLELDVEAWDPIDSSNVSPEHWLAIAQYIAARADHADGFVVLHGTDTMAYTASALSFLLADLTKPVILTGAQRPLVWPDSDAPANLTNALRAAAGLDDQPRISEVCIAFGDVLLRGNRARKTSATDDQGFHSPNYPPFLHFNPPQEGCHAQSRYAGVGMPAGPRDQPDPSESSPLPLTPSLNPHVLSLPLFPGLPVETLRAILALPELRGVVLQTYGTGNAPTDSAFLSILEHAIRQRDLVIVNVTQCQHGAVNMGSYDAGARLRDIGLTTAGDMTPEAALTKLMLLLGQDRDAAWVRQQMAQNLRGELTLL